MVQIYFYAPLGAQNFVGIPDISNQEISINFRFGIIRKALLVGLIFLHYFGGIFLKQRIYVPYCAPRNNDMSIDFVG